MVVWNEEEISRNHPFGRSAGGYRQKRRSFDFRGCASLYGEGALGVRQWPSMGSRANNIVLAGTWCAQCIKPDIEEMGRRAAERGGKCLSAVYVNSVTKLDWQCSEGHIWQTKPNTALRRWCPSVPTDEDWNWPKIRRIARSKGGRLLFKDYINNQTPLWWRCQEGHIWSAPAAQVKDGETRGERGARNATGYRSAAGPPIRSPSKT